MEKNKGKSKPNMSNLYFADASSNPFANSPPETLNTRMLPTCLRRRRVTGVFTSVSNLARMQGIGQGTPYALIFSPTNNTYVFDVGGVEGVDQGVTTFGTYSWSLADSWRASAGGGFSTSSSRLSLHASWRAAGMSIEAVEEDDVAGMVIATDRNVAKFSSPLGIATFDITPLVASSTKGSRSQQ
jgi:hypothetical protein